MCGAMRTTSLRGQRCRKPALPKTDPPRCEQHFMEYATKAPGHAHRFYGARLRPSLAQAMSEYLEAEGAAGQLDVSAELFLLRDAASHAVEKYSDVCAAEGASLEARVLAGQLMSVALREVLDAVKVAGQVEEVRLRVAGHFAACMREVLRAVVAAANRAFENDCRVATFERLLREEIAERAAAAGRDGGDGTAITPDQCVLEMDAATAPAEPAGD